MIQGTLIEVDKQFTPQVSESYGKIQIRVVVFKKKSNDEKPTPLPPADATDDEVLPTIGKTPLDSYLERPEHGKQCAVFLVNGQRHEAWDNTFLIKDLNLKYLRTRTMVVVDLDGLSVDAISDMVQGSRQGLYDGDVKDAIRERLYATLKNDPDLKRLQQQAEQDVAELDSGDDAIRNKLDQLIDAHAANAPRLAGGADVGGDGGKAVTEFGPDAKQPVVSVLPPSEGQPATGPYLVSDATSSSLRLRPGVERQLKISAGVPADWALIEALAVEVSPGVKELQVSEDRGAGALTLTMLFVEPEGFDQNDYPVETSIRVTAKFKGHVEPRVLEKDISINKAVVRQPVKPNLLPVPTLLRVVSRQPIRLVSGGASTHVRLQWNGEDALASGAGATWSFSAQCLSLANFPAMAFSTPRDGRFELLVDVPHGLRPESKLDFEVVATGPNGQQLRAPFSGVVYQPTVKAEDEPRRIEQLSPTAVTSRRPPYDLKFVEESNWKTVECWGRPEWTGQDAGCFMEPTDTTPLTLVINRDMADLVEFKRTMAKRNLVEATVTQRVTHFESHVAFHLYQMYRDAKAAEKAKEQDPGLHVPSDAEHQQEINRVATTLLKMMEVAAR